MQKRINVLVNCPNPTDATSLYRGIGPLGDLQRNWPELRYNFADKYTWSTFAMNDIFFLQRPFSDIHLREVMMAMDCGVPVWVDYDDDLFSVPVSNPTYPVYSNEETRKRIAKIIALASVVTVSTPALKKSLELGPQPLNKDIRVIPNAIDTKMFGYRRFPGQTRDKLVAWRGSTTHQQDIHCFLPEIVQAVNSDESWSWLFQGDKPWFLYERLGKNAIFAEGIDPIQYFRQMHEMKPSMMIVPLQDTRFNRAKSNIAWLEAAFFGALTIAPDWEEWQRPGCLNYSNPKAFLNLIEECRLGYYHPSAMANEAWDYVMDNLQLREVNRDRRRLIEGLL